MKREIRSLAEAVEAFTSIEQQEGEVIVFRGHADHTWRMTAPILRPSSAAIQAKESELVRELIAVAPEAFQPDQSMFDRLVRMQHFGLPTRLLDMTSNPLVALFFATDETDEGADGAVVVARFEREQQKYFDSDTVSCLANLANLSDDEKETIENTKARVQSEFNRLNPVDRLVQFVRSEKPAFRNSVVRTDLFKRLHVVPKLSNPRIVAQSGSFILFGLPRPKNTKVPINLTRIRVPSACKTQIRHDLERLGVTKSSLFPELDKAASHIVDKLGR